MGATPGVGNTTSSQPTVQPQSSKPAPQGHTFEQLSAMGATPGVAQTAPQSSQGSSQGSQDPGFMGNLQSGNYGGAAVDALKNTAYGIGKAYNAVASPLEGVAAIPFQAGLAGYNKLTGQNIPDPFAQGVPSPAQLVGGTPTPVSPLNAEQKIGNAAQVGSFLIPGSGILSGAAMGALQGAGSAMSQGENAQNVATQGTVGGVTGGAFGLVGRALSAFGSKTLNSIIKPNAADIKDGFSLDTIKNNNLGGSLDTIKNKTQSLLSNLSSQLRSKLQGSTSNINLGSIFDKTTKDLQSQEGLLSNFGQTQGVGRALKNLQDEVLNVNPTGSLSIPDAQMVKQAAGGMGAWQYGSADPDAGAVQTVYNTFYKNLKTAIEDNSPAGVKEINSKISDLIPVMNAVIRRIPIAARNGGISLPDMLGFVVTAMNPIASIPTAIEMASHSGSVGGLLSKYGGLTGKLAAPATAGVNGLLSTAFPQAQ